MLEDTNIDVKSIDPITRAKCMLSLVNDDLNALNEMHKNLSPSFFRASKNELNKRKSSILFWFPELRESEAQNEIPKHRMPHRFHENKLKSA